MRGPLAAVATLAVSALALSLGAAHAEPPPEPDGYRLNAYRTAVPATLLDAQVLGTDEAHALWQAGQAVFIDVMPSPPRPANLPEGTIWKAPKRTTIEGAHWLPNVGFGAIAPDLEAYFARALDTLTDGARDRPVVIYCLEDCWMSWNAARRAILELGYTSVAWYPAGTDGWMAADHPVATVTAWE